MMNGPSSPTARPPHAHAMGMPKMAIVTGNTLAVIGLKQLLSAVMRGLQVQAFNRFDDFVQAGPEGFVHFFVDFSIVLENIPFFYAQKRKTIVLTLSPDADKQLAGYHCLCINVPEEQLVRSLLMLEQHGHPHGISQEKGGDDSSQRLSDREIEVLALVAQGFINKEIADRLNIALSTVVSHRKNITEKLGMKSVSALTVYAVMNGYVDINKI